MEQNSQPQQQMSYFKQEVASFELEGDTIRSTVLPDQIAMTYPKSLILHDQDHSVKSFLQRPIDLLDVQFKTTNSKNDELIPGGLSFPEVLLENEAFNKKVTNFVGLRGEVSILISINPQKFQQGILWAYWIPNAKAMPAKVAMIQKGLSGKTGCPGGTPIKMQGATQFEIVAPYVNSYEFYNLVTNQGGYGKLYLTVMSPLESTTQNDFVDIKIQGDLKTADPMFATAARPLVQAQGMEDEILHAGKTLDMPGTTMQTLEDTINIIPKDLKPSTLLKSASNVAQLIGYSKPESQAGVFKNKINASNYLANYNGESVSKSLGMASNHESYTTVGSDGTKESMMSLQNIMKVPCYYTSFTFKNTNNVGDIIWADDHHPQKYFPNTDGSYSSTFVGYASSPFTLWQGKLKYKFYCAKTIFHSGKLRITYIPGIYANNVVNGQINVKHDINQAYSKTIDLKEVDEFEFIPEYASTGVSLYNINPYSRAASTIPKYNWCPGAIFVEVFTALRSPQDTVVPSIEISVFVSSEDIQPMALGAPIVFPVNISSTTVQAESSDQVLRIHEQKNYQEGITGHKNTSLLPSAVTSGEYIGTINQIIKRNALYAEVNPPAGDVVQISPYDFKAPYSIVPTAVSSLFPFDYLDYFSYIFGFWTGGVTLNIIPSNSGSRDNSYEVRMIPSLSPFYFNSFPRAGVFSSQVKDAMYTLPYAAEYAKPSLEGVISLDIPTYKRLDLMPCLVENQTNDATEEGFWPLPVVLLRDNNGTTSWPARLRIMRCAKDNFQFHYLLGPPSVVLLDLQDNKLELQPYVSMTQQSQQVTTGVGFTNVSPFLSQASLDFVATTPYETLLPTQIVAFGKTTTGAANWDMLILPKRLKTSFLIENSVMRVTPNPSLSPAFAVIQLLDFPFGRDSSAAVPTSKSTYFKLDDISPSATPITTQRGQLATVSFTTTNITVPTLPSITLGTTVSFTSNVVAITEAGQPVIIPKNTGMIFSYQNVSSSSFRVVINVGIRVLYMILSVGTATQYTNGSVPKPYVLNQAI